MQNVSGLIGHYSSSIKHEVACFSNSDPSSMQSEILSHSAPTTPYLHSIEAQTRARHPIHTTRTTSSYPWVPCRCSTRRTCDCLFPSKLEQVVFSVWLRSPSNSFSQSLVLCSLWIMSAIVFCLFCGSKENWESKSKSQPLWSRAGSLVLYFPHLLDYSLTATIQGAFSLMPVRQF